MDAAAGKLLVVVDDNEANRDMLSRRLSRRGDERLDDDVSNLAVERPVTG